MMRYRIGVLHARAAYVAWDQSDYAKRRFWSWAAMALRSFAMMVDDAAWFGEQARRVLAEVREEREAEFYQQYVDARLAGDDRRQQELLSHGP